MTTLRIAVLNLLRHRMSSVVVLFVFSISAFVLFWGFGFSNYIINNVEAVLRDSYGDVAFTIPLTERSRLAAVFEDIASGQVEKLVFEREVQVMIDGKSKSAVAPVAEITAENGGRLARYFRPTEGRMPLQDDEIAVTQLATNIGAKVGDSIYVTATTPDKVINTVKYRITGYLKGSAVKGLGLAFTITEKSMSALTGSADHANLIYAFAKPEERTPEGVLGLQKRLRARLGQAGIAVNETWTVTERKAQFDIFSRVFRGTKYILLGLVFPLVGTVLAAMVRVYTHRRRREIWTYQSLGMKDRSVILTVGLEYWLLAGMGALLGLGLGLLTAGLCAVFNVWLVFSYTFACALRAELGGADFVNVLVFMLVIVVVWSRGPIMRILRAIPFSY